MAGRDPLELSLREQCNLAKVMIIDRLQWVEHPREEIDKFLDMIDDPETAFHRQDAAARSAAQSMGIDVDNLFAQREAALQAVRDAQVAPGP